MKYFLDTEFLEGKQKSLKNKKTSSIIILSIVFILTGLIKDGFSIINIILILMSLVSIFLWVIVFTYKEKTKPTIDLISIGIVSENDREYYAISKDFNLKEAWNRWQHGFNLNGENNEEVPCKEYWLRDNVLKLIFNEFIELEYRYKNTQERIMGYSTSFNRDFTYSNFKKLLNKYGKTNKEIAREVTLFCNPVNESIFTTPEFYAYYGAYDWVVFCWLFGKMIDLPKNFPMFSRDLKVMLDDKAIKSQEDYKNKLSLKELLNLLKHDPTYPKQNNLHNALDDAKWNKNLYNFIKTL